jgi:hypothetical protein
VPAAGDSGEPSGAVASPPLHAANTSRTGSILKTREIASLRASLKVYVIGVYPFIALLG